MAQPVQPAPIPLSCAVDHAPGGPAGRPWTVLKIMSSLGTNFFFFDAAAAESLGARLQGAAVAVGLFVPEHVVHEEGG